MSPFIHHPDFISEFHTNCVRMFIVSFPKCCKFSQRPALHIFGTTIGWLC